jgi:hypothetical protein
MFTALWPIAARDRVEYRKLAVRNKQQIAVDCIGPVGPVGLRSMHIREEHAASSRRISSTHLIQCMVVRGCQGTPIMYSISMPILTSSPAGFFASVAVSRCRGVAVSELHARTRQDRTRHAVTKTPNSGPVRKRSSLPTTAGFSREQLAVLYSPLILSHRSPLHIIACEHNRKSGW